MNSETEKDKAQLRYKFSLDGESWYQMPEDYDKARSVILDTWKPEWAVVRQRIEGIYRKRMQQSDLMALSSIQPHLDQLDKHQEALRQAYRDWSTFFQEHPNTTAPDFDAYAMFAEHGSDIPERINAATWGIYESENAILVNAMAARLLPVPLNDTKAE